MMFIALSKIPREVKMRDSVDTENVPCIKSTAKSCKNSKQKNGNPSKKLPLHELQPSAVNQQLLVGKNGVVGLQSNRAVKKKGTNGVKVKTKDTENVPIISKTKGSDDCSSPSDIADEAYRLMISDTIPSDYWKEVAEQRRVALEIALKENEELHCVTATLREENALLREMAEQAEHLSKILKSLTEEEGVSEEEID